MSQHEVVLLLGSNLGDKKKNIEEAVQLIEENIGNVIISSKILETRPIDFVSVNFFFNFAIQLETVFSPIELLNRIKFIEQKLGRMHDSRELGGYQDRIIDIDIVFYDQVEFISKRLELPHKAHLERAFSINLIKDLKKNKT
jgi:2-amino-4-hydroxy-6-hydroxymethyldihydropteridine diphosphokinase